MNNIVFDEENPVTSDQLIWALFGKSTEDVARMFRDGKNGEYDYLFKKKDAVKEKKKVEYCLLYTSPSPRDRSLPRMPSSA